MKQTNEKGDPARRWIALFMVSGQEVPLTKPLSILEDYR